jgi:hypothetical protein
MVRLTGHCRFVKLDTGRLKNYAINWDIDTSIDLNNITDADFVPVDRYWWTTISSDFDSFGTLLNFKIFKELSFLRRILPGCEKSNNSDCSKHCKRLNPSHWTVFRFGRSHISYQRDG